MSKGRTAKVTREKYLDAVKSCRTDKDIVIAKHLGVHRSNIGRFKKNNPDVVKKGEAIILKFTSVVFDAKNLTYEAFIKIPIIEKWLDIQTVRRNSYNLKRSRTFALFNVCRHLNVHPENLTLELSAKIVNEAKTAYYDDVDFISGLAYLNIRKPVRSFYQLIHGISGEMLSSLGISAESSKGVGSASKERVLKEQREIFSKVLYDCVYEIINDPSTKRFDRFKGLEGVIYLEMKGIAYFMYYTATRIGSTNPKIQGSLSIRMNNIKHVLTKKTWRINVLDKGEKGGIEWDKLMMDDGILKLKQYISERFNLEFDDIETKMKTIDSFLFPILNGNYDLERRIMRSALEKAGVTTRNPNHIWRHTFAQDGLHATDWNYELIASIGGWKDTGTLKKHYGEMSEDAKERGLRKAMGLPVEDVTYELRW